MSRVTVSGLGERQRAALADLLGMDRYPPSTLTIAVTRLDAVMDEMAGCDTRTATETIIGPIGDRAAERRDWERRRTALWSWLVEHPVVVAEPALLDWVADVRRRGLVAGSLEDTRAMLEQALSVLAVLPADGRPLAAFATDTLGDPHALDEGRRLSGVVLKALSCVYAIAPPDDAVERRALWERAGIACDSLSTTVLVAGMRPSGSDALAHSLNSWADAGQASVLTLAQLAVSPSLHDIGPTVWVTENPSIVALAVQHLGRRCPPLVCSSGWPNSAAIRLLRDLAASGCVLRYHGDFDGEGLRIAAHVIVRTGARPWRMSAADYRAALVNAPGPFPSAGRVSDSPWDTELARLLAAHDAAIAEEAVAEFLLADLESESDERIDH
ncbi:TIGR02679 family protein [Actinomadura sp. 9N215]|uniref:TIGR02679 family protein n=1 Tax=Actinomadura sp. 9N215 TaxID=3375150 RepID=UPI0037AE8C68